MAMHTKGLFLFSAILAIAYSYRINDDFYDSPDTERSNFYDISQEKNYGNVDKRSSHGCKFFPRPLS